MAQVTSIPSTNTNLATFSSKENGTTRLGKVKSLEKQTENLEHGKPRQTLGVIQTSVHKGLTRQSEKAMKPKKIIPQSQVRVFEDPKEITTTNIDAEIQTEISGDICKKCSAKIQSGEDEAYELMVQEEVPLSYWRELAEQRRQALDDSLLENELLHAEVSQLKEENEKLTDLASQAEYFAEMFKMVTEVDEAESKVKSQDSQDSEEETDDTSPDRQES